jgi:hypothetical protein
VSGTVSESSHRHYRYDLILSAIARVEVEAIAVFNHTQVCTEIGDVAGFTKLV